MKYLVLFALVASTYAITYEERSKVLVKEINSRTNNWKAGVSQKFQGATMDELKVLLGSKLGARLPVDEEMEKELKNTKVPASFDSRTKWTKCSSIGKIRDQSNCGSCWAVSAAEVATDRTCIGNNGASNPTLSAEFLMTCCSSCGYGCEGGYPIKAMDFWKNTGLVTGGDYGNKDCCQSYQIKPCTSGCSGSAATPACSHTCQSSYSNSYSSDLHKATKAYSVSPKQGAIKRQIYNHGPVQAAYTVYEDFMNYQSGVYHHVSGEELGGHAVRILGWGTENGTPYWLVANSWGTNWGLSGYFKIQRGNDECGIEDGIVAGQA